MEIEGNNKNEIENEKKENKNKKIKIKEEIKIIYRVTEEKLREIKIFGKNFVINNKNNCKIRYNKKEFQLAEKFKSEIYLKTGKFEIFLIGINKIVDAGYMFSGCSLLISLPDISIWITSEVKNFN